MPKVGDKEFPYDEEGLAAAEAEAARTGLPVEDAGEGDRLRPHDLSRPAPRHPRAGAADTSDEDAHGVSEPGAERLSEVGKRAATAQKVT